jgi:arylsulfatase A-like enzyme
LLAAVTLAGVFFLLPQPSNAADSSASGTRPLNIVFLVVDDLGWDLGCYGADLHETPHIDWLARQGMRFTDAYAAAPVCSPTRASILTGKHPARLQMTIWYGAAV